MTTLDSFLKDASSFVNAEFGFDIEQSKLKPYSPDNWQTFCQVNNFDMDRLRKYQTNLDHEEKSRKKYIQSFSQNAEQLSLGNKPLTLKNLKKIYAK